MTYIQQPDMDIHAEAIDEYARYGGLRPGMVVGPLDLPFYPPEPVPSWDDMSWRERIDSIKPGLIATTWLVAAVTILGSIAMVLSAFANGVLR